MIRKVEMASSILRYLKITVLSVALCVLINVLSYYLKDIIFQKAELAGFLDTVIGLSLVSIIVGMVCLSKGKIIVGLSLIFGVILTVIFWVATMYSLSTHGW